MLTASVIIPSYNRPDKLVRVLDCLSEQTWRGEPWEVIVVDDGSSLPYTPTIEQPWPFAFRYIRQENSGEVLARMRGVQQAASDFLIFLDDDIYVDPGYIAALVDEHRRYPDAVLLGVLAPYLSSHPSPVERALAQPSRNIQPGETSFLECGTGTMAVGRAVYERAGGMQTLGPGGRNAWGGMDFAYRAVQTGSTVRRVVEATAAHDDDAQKSLARISRRYFHISKMAVLHFRRHPELLPLVPMFRDKTPIQWRSDPPGLITRKLARRLLQARPVLSAMRAVVALLETVAPKSALLACCYRWIARGNILHGYRAGLREFPKDRR